MVIPGPLDLAKPASIHNFVSQYRKQNLPLHILVNNAGAAYRREWYTEEGVAGLTQVCLRLTSKMLLLISDASRLSWFLLTDPNSNSLLLYIKLPLKDQPPMCAILSSKQAFPMALHIRLAANEHKQFMMLQIIDCLPVCFTCKQLITCKHQTPDLACFHSYFHIVKSHEFLLLSNVRGTYFAVSDSIC